LEAVLDPAILHFWGSKKPWRWNHRPEGARYERIMREVGLLTDVLPGTTAIRRLEGLFFAMFHTLLRCQVKWRLHFWYNATMLVTKRPRHIDA